MLLQEEEGIIIKVFKKNHLKFKSFSTKLSLTIALILCISISLILIANSIFLEDYYVNNNKNVFLKEYNEIKKEFSEPNDEIISLLSSRDSKTGFLYYISDLENLRNKKIILASNPIPLPMGNFMMRAMPNSFNEMPIKESMIPQVQSEYILSNLDIIKTEGYIFSQVHRVVPGSNEFDLVFAGELENEYLLLIIRPVEQLAEQTAITNKFLLIIGFISLVFSIFVAHSLAKTIVKPIKDITKITGKIAKLDFSNKYEGNSIDEIGELGSSINEISYQLDKSISELEDSNKKLEIENNLQKKFFAGISHEFKTPIGLISGYAETLKLGLAKNTQERYDYTNIILEETDKLNHLVNDILFLIKSESTEFILNFKEINVITLLQNSVKKYENIIKEKDIYLIMNMSKCFTINGDSIRLSQIFENILSNAFRYTNNGKKIIINATEKENNVLIEFINEGSQIDNDHIVHLFDPFYSAYEARDRFSSGTGLGLSIVKNLVNKHNGTINIENYNDNGIIGVRVWVLFPSIK
ncbi:MAG: sensor histidine kinase [Pleomorphochaeta sp.]